MDLPRSYAIRVGDMRILGPYTADKLATLGAAIDLRAGQTMLDLASGRGEMLCTWARDHGITGTGMDISTVSTAKARKRAVELGVADRVTFLHGDATGYVAEEPVDVAALIGVTRIFHGVPGTLRHLERSLRPGGMALVGESYWRLEPPDQATVEACYAPTRDHFKSLPDLVRLFGDEGWDLVEMVLTDQDSWDRYAAAHWLNRRRWLDANPDDELAAQMREELTTEPLRYVTNAREYVGWGIFALMKR
ncbi:SAM-dependent methyltransferase [Plantactinospora sp. GCM10030261]|uniref:SAM-dependent methyltransferase n=1 Tax=Plantactinospora sp. GCM10030261 TaxID=3273420 RepID=UPI0036064DC5